MSYFSPHLFLLLELMMLDDRVNWGRPRDIPVPTAIPPFNVHRSVQARMDATDLKNGKYVPLPLKKVQPQPNWLA